MILQIKSEISATHLHPLKKTVHNFASSEKIVEQKIYIRNYGQMFPRLK